LRRAAHRPAYNETLFNQEIAMGNRKLRVGQAISPEEFEELSEEELTRLVPRQYRDYFPGKDACGDGFFYLHDGTAWSFVSARQSHLDDGMPVAWKRY
jgi:hypothetical protein